MLAYTAAVVTYQLGNLSVDPAAALTTSAAALALASGTCFALVRFGRHQILHLIPLVAVD